MVDLGTLGGTSSWAYGINTNGDVVGQAETRLSGDFSTHAFLYSSGKGMIDLNTLISSNSGWKLLNAKGINDSGQITGGGLINGSYHAYLLTPPTHRSKHLSSSPSVLMAPVHSVLGEQYFRLNSR